MEDRKKAHINLAFQSQTNINTQDQRFSYEPMLAAHPVEEEFYFDFLGKVISSPIWASSMTGGTGLAKQINQNIAKVSKKFGMGMGLGSCRIILKDDTYFEDFDVRDSIGNHLPLMANLGIAQIEELLKKGDELLIEELIQRLRADGLIVHINPMQEWLQPEGNPIQVAPIDTLKKLIKKASYPILVKEVGQGMGYQSIKAVLDLPFEAVEFGAFGGTNFAMLEMLRADESLRSAYEPLASIGQNPYQMVKNINQIIGDGSKIRTQKIIVSGGIKSFLDGYYLSQTLKLPSIYGMASSILKYAQISEEALEAFIDKQTKGYFLARNYLRINENFLNQF